MQQRGAAPWLADARTPLLRDQAGIDLIEKAGKFTIPGLCMIKTRMKPARKAGTRLAFGKTIKVKAAPAKKIVKAFCVSALKKSV